MPLNYLFEILEFSRKRESNSFIKPSFINFLLTYRCNARCAMCNAWSLYKDNPGLAKEELTAREIEKFIIDNRDDLSRLRSLGLTGGDPLLMRDDFVEVVRIIRKNLPHVQTGVQTNGLIPELAYERLKEIVSFYPKFSISVSIDAIGDMHSKIRGVPDAFEKATQTIKYAQSLNIKNITCGMTLSAYSYNQIKEVKDYVESLGLEFSCFLAEASDYFNNLSKNDFMLNDAQKVEIIKELRECCSYHYFMDNLRLQLEGKRSRELPCFSGLTSLVIDPYGNVKPCILKVKGIEDDVFGNIRKSLLKDMLTSEKANKIKNQIKKCSCWCQCEVSSSLVSAPFDILKWFLFYCKDKKGFISQVLKKKKKIDYLLGKSK